MGLFGRFRKHLEDTIDDLEEDLAETIEAPEFKTQLMAMLIFMGAIFVLRLFTSSRVQAMRGEHVLDVSALNSAGYFKEVFLAYLNAALLEPVLAIAGMEKAEGTHLLINLMTLGSICWWIWLVTDAFDYFDVTQQYKYNFEFAKDLAEARKKDGPSKYGWLRLRSKEQSAKSDKSSLVGSISRDVGLWFMIACSGAAWLPGMVTHRDVLHAHAVLVFWCIQHHLCRNATCWGSMYIVTFLFPSAALMPLQYCLPLMDVADTVEDLDFIEQYRIFIKERTGVELIIES